MQCLYQRGGGSATAAATARITEYDAAAREMAVVRLARESAVVIFSVSGCCMCHAVKRLFSGMGVSPTVHELDLLQHPIGRNIHMALLRLLGSGGGCSIQFPVVFVGGRLVGSMDRVMAAHINGSLVPLLKEAGALWL